MVLLVIQQSLHVRHLHGIAMVTTYTTSGAYDYTFTNGTCVDTVRLNLTIGNGAVTDTTVSACQTSHGITMVRLMLQRSL